MLSSLHADVELATSINDVFYRGSSELAGSITMTVTGNDFSGATEEESIYIRITFDKQAQLAHTLVDQTGVGDQSNPIFLAMDLMSNDPSLQLNAPSDTVSIVRWVASENTIWLCIKRDSSSWIAANSGTMAPDSNANVAFTLGISARVSATALQDVPETSKNLPFNTRFPEASDPAAAISTLICLDLSESALTTSGIESLIQYDIISFDHTALVSPGVYASGNNAGVPFTSDFRIARGKDRNVEVPVFGASGVDTCLADAPIDNWGFTPLTSKLQFRLNSSTGSNVLTTDLFPGASITLTIPEEADYGFDNLSVAFLNEDSGLEILEDSVTLHDRTLYKKATLVWTGEVTPLNNLDLEVEATIQYYVSETPSNVSLDWSFTFVNHDSPYDDAPYDGDHQKLRCDASKFTPIQGSTFIGSFSNNLLITRQPEDIAVCSGQSVSFEAAATGGGLSYQWYKNDAALPLETSAQLSLGLVSAVNAGTYHCEISNSCDVKNTRRATLTVNEEAPCGEVPAGNVRLIPHITGVGNGFNSSLVFTNGSGSRETVTYKVYFTNNAPLTVSTEVNPLAETTQLLTEESMEGASHLELIDASDAVKMTVVYQSTSEGSGPAHVGEATELSTRWRVFAGNPAVTWDGLAVVNRGVQAADMVVIQVNADGQELARKTIAANLEPNTKTIALISDHFSHVEGASFEVRCEQPVAITALRGNLGSNFLWESPSLPLD